MSVGVRAATHADLDTLGRMNKHLFEDAGSQNPMSEADLRDRMAAWLEDAAMEIRIFTGTDGEIVGYAVFHTRPDAYDPDVNFVYVRQFFIERQWRRLGLGRAAFAALTDACFPARCKVNVDALAPDKNATQFWRKLGFQPYSINMMLYRGYP